MSGLFAPLRLTERALEYHLARHQVVASNLANAQTPGYRPNDLAFEDALEQAGGMVATHKRHIGAKLEPGEQMVTRSYEDVGVAPGVNGNAVSVDRQMAKLAANSLRFRAAAEMISRRLGMMRYAASDGRR